jgi:HlyD family secretion protein
VVILEPGQFPIIEHAPPTPFSHVRRLVLTGAIVVAVFLGGFGTWAVLAPLHSAAIAPGVIQVETYRKTVQHLEGGIIVRILVRDGDEVKAGQPLVRLDDTKAKTTFAAVRAQLFDAYARHARLIAERDGADAIQYPEALEAAASDRAVAQIIAGQQTIFATRRTLLASRIAAIDERIRQSTEEIHGLEAQDEAARKRLALSGEELNDIRMLLAKGLERKSRLLQLESEQAEISGNRGRLAAEIARAQQVIAESQVNIATLKNDSANEVAQQLRDTEEKVSQLEEQRQAAADVLARVEVRSPEEGVVTDLRVHTPGGVVKPGDPLLDLVPKGTRMVVNARVRPEDMDLVRVGLPALVRLLPYKQRRTPPVAGTVVYVSADRLIDERPQGLAAPGQPYFLAKVEISEEGLKKLPDVQLIPGMPTEVMIETGETTVAAYALSPVLDSFDRAFREK